MTGELVQENGDAIYAAAALEMRLDLFRRSAVVDIAHKDAALVDVLSVLAEVMAFAING